MPLPLKVLTTAATIAGPITAGTPALVLPDPVCLGKSLTLSALLKDSKNANSQGAAT